MKILNIIILALGLFGGSIGGNFFNDRKIAKIEKVHKKEINFKVDTITTLKQNINFIVKSDSLKQAQINELQTTMLAIQKQNWQLKRDSIKTSQALKEVLAWKLDAQDGIVTDTVKIEYKTNIFGKRKRIK